VAEEFILDGVLKFSKIEYLSSNAYREPYVVELLRPELLIEPSKAFFDEPFWNYLG